MLVLEERKKWLYQYVYIQGAFVILPFPQRRITNY